MGRGGEGYQQGAYQNGSGSGGRGGWNCAHVPA